MKNEKSPLFKLLEWFQALDQEIQMELLSLCLVFHYDNEIKSLINQDERREKFLAYLDSSRLSNNEIITRALFVTQLFDIAFVGRDTEDGWDNAMNVNLDARNRLISRGQFGEFIDDALKGWQTRKYLWINLAKQWNEVKRQHLDVIQLDEWYRKNLI